MADHSIKIFSEIKTPEVRQELDDFLASMNFPAIQKMPSRGDIDLLLYELSDDTESDFAAIQNMMDSEDISNIFVISKHLDAGLILRAMHIGVKDYFPLPLEKDRFARALKKIKSRTASDQKKSQIRKGQIINVIGSKGGVGTTTIAVNLAVALADTSREQSVALIDMNTIFGEVPLFLDIPSRYHWGEIANNIERVDSTYLLNAMTQHGPNLYVLPSPGRLNGQPAVLNRSIVTLFDLMRQVFDFIVIDSGQRLDELALETIHFSDEILIVSVLNLPCLANTNKLLSSLKEMGLVNPDAAKVIVNRYLKKTSITLKEAEKSIDTKIFWTIPNEYSVSMSSINQGKPLLETKPRSKIAKQITKLAETISTQTCSK